MDILHTPVRFPPDIGGVETYVYNLAKKSIDQGHNVTVVCAKVNEETNYLEIIDGINVRRLTSAGQIGNTNITPALPAVLVEEARAADVIHTHLPTPWFADLSALAGFITRTPVVLTYHNDIIGEGFTDYVARIYNQSMLKITLRLSDRIIVTQPGYVEHSPHLQSVKDKIEVVSNGVDIERFRPLTVDANERARLGFDESRPTLFFLSVLDGHHEYKGLADLLKAMALLAESDTTTPQLLVGGGGKAKSEYEQQAAELGVKSFVEFLGRVPDDDLVSYYSAADLFVLPSTSSDQEGFGLVLLEALACGTPVVTTDVVGVSAAVHDNDIGGLVPRNNPVELATEINRLLSSELDSDSARALCEDRYSWQSSAEQIERIYSDF